MKKVRIGVVGARRGADLINYCKKANNSELVAICDNCPEALEKQRQKYPNDGVTFYDSFDEFLKHDMDAVVLANFANDHAPFAIRAMNAGFHVFSEVLPVETLKEAVELIETVEKTGKIYAYGENYCYMRATAEMRRLYLKGRIGEFEYGEGEYIHNCEPIWPDITYGERDHWRNNMYSTFYCTHSLGPIIHITGLRPVSVTGFESTKVDRKRRNGAKGGLFGIEMVTLENGGIVKSIHGDLYKNSIWYTIYGSLGRIESAREDARCDGTGRVYVLRDEEDANCDSEKYETYLPERPQDDLSHEFGHGSSDFYSMYNFTERILGDENADVIDVYEALDMFLPGMFAYRSILAGGIPMEIPNLRLPEEREKWRNDTHCVTPEKAGDMLLPTSVGGTPDISDEVYHEVEKKYLASR